MRNFKDKVVWITGASSGIGEELAYAFAKEGAHLVLSARNEEKLQQVKNQCLLNTGKCIVRPLDLADADNNLSDTVFSVMEDTGGVDVLINNAGRSQRSLAKQTPIEVDRAIMELNFFSVVALTKLVLPCMINKGNGHIVVVSSITGKFGFPLRTAYSASKHALQGYFEALRAELMPDNIDVTIVSPGRIKTDISINAITHTGESYNIMDDGQAGGMAANRCAAKIVRAIKRKRKDVLIGNAEILMVYIRRFFPWLFFRIVSKIKN